MFVHKKVWNPTTRPILYMFLKKGCMTLTFSLVTNHTFHPRSSFCGLQLDTVPLCEHPWSGSLPSVTASDYKLRCRISICTHWFVCRYCILHFFLWTTNLEAVSILFLLLMCFITLLHVPANLYIQLLHFPHPRFQRFRYNEWHFYRAKHVRARIADRTASQHTIASNQRLLLNSFFSCFRDIRLIRRIEVTSLTFQGHVTSSVTWPFDTPYANCYWWSFET